MKLTMDELIGKFAEMTVGELTEFRRKFEEKFGVTAMPRLAPVEALDDTQDVEEQTEFQVMLDACGPRKVEVIKAVREISHHSLGLKEAKDVVDTAPTLLLNGVSRDVAEGARAKLQAVGATVSVT